MYYTVFIFDSKCSGSNLLYICTFFPSDAVSMSFCKNKLLFVQLIHCQVSGHVNKMLVVCGNETLQMEKVLRKGVVT